MTSPSSRSVHPEPVAVRQQGEGCRAATTTLDLALEDFEAEWGVVDLGRYARQLRDARNDTTERFLAQYAQALRCEAATSGHAEETAHFFGAGEHRGRGVERRLTAADWARERSAEADHGRDQPPVHGTASGYTRCAPPGARRCDLCRAYQRERVRRSRADRVRRGLCTGTRSSYDAGCRCTACVAANSSGCASWRARRDDVRRVAA